MEVFTSLGVGAIFSKTSTINNKQVAGATSFMTKDDAFYKFASIKIRYRPEWNV